MLEKAYILEGSATLTPDDADKHGEPVTVNPGDMCVKKEELNINTSSVP